MVDELKLEAKPPMVMNHLAGACYGTKGQSRLAGQPRPLGDPVWSMEMGSCRTSGKRPHVKGAELRMH